MAAGWLHMAGLNTNNSLKKSWEKDKRFLQHIFPSSVGQGASGQCDGEQDQLSLGRGHQLLVRVEDP